MDSCIDEINAYMRLYLWFHRAREVEPGVIGILTCCETWTDEEILSRRCFHGLACELRVYQGKENR